MKDNDYIYIDVHNWVQLNDTFHKKYNEFIIK